ncbi:MAG: hypothetical protein C4567_11075 [Deltaproteobacteria bacterium]|nr:MAG: hypothetical protein C4567_11075 [Deltaproteobacteria bacterium]
MGTSSARRAPTTWRWRRAKAAAGRYLAPEEGAGLEAREVVARYLAALGEDGASGQGLAAEFRLTRKAAQNLGAFLSEAASRGWDAAWGATTGSSEPGPFQETARPVLASTLLEADGGLEAAVARSSLVMVLHGLEGAPPPSPAQAVARFLAEALYQRLTLDLGESLEATGRSYGQWRQGLAGLRSWIVQAGEMELDEPPPPQQWRGLAGWQWVTLALEKMLGRLQE